MLNVEAGLTPEPRGNGHLPLGKNPGLAVRGPGDGFPRRKI